MQQYIHADRIPVKYDKGILFGCIAEKESKQPEKCAHDTKKNQLSEDIVWSGMCLCGCAGKLTGEAETVYSMNQANQMKTFVTVPHRNELQN